MNIKSIKIIAIIIFLLFLLYIGIKPIIQVNEISEYRSFTIGEITSIESGHRASPSIFYYSYNFNEREFNDSRAGYSLNQTFKNKNFPIILSEVNPRKNRMLIYPRDFERFDIPFPDSLNWVKEYDSDSVIEFF